MSRLHPRSAVVRIARAALQGGFFGFFGGSLGSGMFDFPWFAVPGLAALGAVVFSGYALARYLRFQYELDGDTLTVESGVFARQSRQIPLGRVQNLDVEQNILNRLLGLAIVRFETAGGSATEATLDAVDEAEVERLRNYVRTHDRDEAAGTAAATSDAVAGTESGRSAHADLPGATGPSSGHAGDAQADTDRGASHTDSGRGPDGSLLFAFDQRELLTYALVSVRPAAPVLTLASLPLGMDVVWAVLRFNAGLVGASLNGPVVRWLLGSPETSRLAVFAALSIAQFLLLALVVSMALTVIEYHGFRLTQADGDLRYERGLLRRYSGNIPLEKVQSVTIRENVLMRRFGYATLAVETAGYSGGNQQSTQGVAVPLAPREEVYELARDIEPFGDLDFDRSPKRARRRYLARFSLAAAGLTGVAYAVDSLVLETGYWWLAALLFLPVAPAAHLRWRHRGYDLSESVLATRSGFWRRTTRIVPYYRLQTVFVTRSPFQRRRDLATVGADTASSTSLLGGVARVFDIDEDTATELRNTLRERLRVDIAARRSGERSVETVERVGETDERAGETDEPAGGANERTDEPDEWSGEA
ncbi:PH domain-containing protein [Haloarcula japonica]|uniref:Membrane-flanked domain-containing protein n=1 Tax=Haloarcula japonica (strain ATCC 49778 / DSM 6131 / JCM 7785 / NBRC 101032 / NCIMB 13157 / TR-1) TaxID=1227453 RepID=M0LE71_HALJT|nr:PH domain-containing protein [Haloarcula japonica]EMA30260.1 membrane-flanked domain-containing protein [Haloarcula japonica DSM 6131]